MIFRGEKSQDQRVGTGKFFERKGEIFVLAAVGGGKVNLICTDGEYYHQPVFVEDMDFLTRAEWNELTGGDGDEFEMVKLSISVVG